MNPTVLNEAENSHEKFRVKVCGSCTKKPKSGLSQNITPTVQDLLQKYRYTNYDVNNKALPKIICKACVMVLKDFDKVGISS